MVLVMTLMIPVVTLWMVIVVVVVLVMLLVKRVFLLCECSGRWAHLSTHLKPWCFLSYYSAPSTFDCYLEV